MIYLLSDLHGNANFDALNHYVNTASDNDLLIILGDVGLKFEKTEQNHNFDKYFLNIDKNIAFIDGNHENFEYLNSFREENWNGGIVGRLTENIVHLKRGNIYNINGKTFFAFGGCKSSPKWKQMGLWYPGEQPCDSELDLAYKNIRYYNYKIDYILTHKYEKSSNPNDRLQMLTDFIDSNVKFDMWYAGHWHESRKFDDKHIFVYDALITVK